MFAIDCEMCLTSSMKNELTSVSLVNEDEEVNDYFALLLIK